MFSSFSLLFSFLLAFPTPVGDSPDVADAPPERELVLEADPTKFAAQASQSRFGGFESTVDDESNPVLRCETVEKPSSPWGFSLRFPVDRPVVKGEILLLEFSARTLDAKTEAGLAVVAPYFETNAPPYTKSLNFRTEISRERRTYSLPFRCAESRDAGQSAVGLFLGYERQTIELSDFRLYSFGTDFDFASLPNTVPRYPGQEADAPWRQAAQERIERYRKGDLTIRAFAADGTPLPDAAVEIRQTRSAFGWGTAVVARRLLQRDADGDHYRQFVADYCERVVFENDLKWFGWQNQRNRADVFQALNWLDERKIKVRGHCLVWPSWRNSPNNWRELADDPEKLAAAVLARVRDEASALDGRVVDWDVVNEIHDNNDLMKILGDDVLVDWFRAARESDPNARLFINDYGILSGEGLDVRKQNSYYKAIQTLIEKGAPVGGIGLQGHFGQNATPPERLLEILNRFAELGLPIAITEHDIDSSDDAFSAEFTRDFLTAAFSCPAVEEILVWGFWERSHWRPNAAYFRADWTPSPAGRVWLDLVGSEWRSNFDEKTNADGELATRVFLGDYQITVRDGDRTQTFETTVSPDGTQLEIRFDK